MENILQKYTTEEIGQKLRFYGRATHELCVQMCDIYGGWGWRGLHVYVLTCQRIAQARDYAYTRLETTTNALTHAYVQSATTPANVQ